MDYAVFLRKNRLALYLLLSVAMLNDTERDAFPRMLCDDGYVSRSCHLFQRKNSLFLGKENQ
jgi:hypothetical protein